MEFLIGTHSQSSEYSELVNSLFGLFFSFFFKDDDMADEDLSQLI